MNKFSMSNRIRIAVLVPNPNAGGGIQIFAKELAENLPKDIDMYFISKCEIRATRFGNLKHEPYFRNFKINLRSFDLILMHQFSIKFYLIALLAKRPIIVVSHIWDLDKTDIKSLILRRIKKQLLKNKKLNLVFVSESVKRNLGINGEVILNRSTFTLPFESFEEAKKDLLFVGRFSKEKGAHVFLEIVENLKSTTNLPLSATMVGEGPEFENLKKTISDFELHQVVDLVPWTTRDELKKKYIAHKILIVPSMWDEPYGLVAAEGMSLGLKVFCSNRPGLIEATMNLANYFDPYSINSVIKDIEYELSNNSNFVIPESYIKELSFSITVEQYCNLIRKIFSENAR